MVRYVVLISKTEQGRITHISWLICVYVFGIYTDRWAWQ